MKEYKIILKCILNKHLKQFISSLGTHISLVFSVIFIFTSAMDIFQLNFNFFRGSWIKFFIFVIAVVLISLIITLIQIQGSFRFKTQIKNNTSIIISVDDYIENAVRYHKAACIFGCNNEFDLNLVKKDSLQYDFTNRFLDQQSAQRKIDSSLAHMNYQAIEVGENKKVYSFGTICCITFEEKSDIETRKLYLFANSARRDFNDFNGDNNTDQLLQNIWNFCEQNDIVERTLLVPLLGTGHSNDLSPMQSVKAIIDTYFANYKSKRILNIIISIHPNSLKSIDLIKVKEYIQFKILEMSFGEEL